METNNIDKNIKEKLDNRTINPSASAWERLSAQLDEQPKQKKKGWFFYVGAAASILLLISVGFLFLNKNEDIKPVEIIVENPIDTITIDAKIDQFINEIPAEEAIVKIDEVEEKQVEVSNKNVVTNKNVIPTKEESKKSINNSIVANNKNNVIPTTEEVVETVVAVSEDHPTKEETINKEILKQDPNSSIKINSDDLLFAVTHSSTEVKEYYAKLNLTREDVLSTIKSELKKSNIKVSPEAILAEVERTIGEEDFQNNFLQSLKKRVTDIATAIASRND
ncbi:hypothetical protein QWY81_12495 [Polaribacter undariae]|uniref:Uncharacterized protein n=1 Tax=Polaribacter sejongensis TaxID=985043 RepID=A0AAJ1VH42_9FLAO|nr:hypothetical protein [Polaribacter undariae]MDN3620276.1 hypothetical protein [Polaribacter undariae]UWD32677.1 hypothetical protein NQP51_03145 [Polaribacter undariae]